MTSMIKPVSKQSVKQVGSKPPVVQSQRSLGMLDYDATNRRARKTSEVGQSADMHSQSSRDRSEHYHARVIGQRTKPAREDMHSSRPGLTAQQGLGG